MAVFRKVTEFKTAAEFGEHLRSLNLGLDLVAETKPAHASQLGEKVNHNNRTIGNRWAILPMEGWDCMPDGNPSDLTARRWIRFAESGAKLIYGTEAAAVMEEGRSNTRQLMMTEQTYDAMAAMYEKMLHAHSAKFGTADDLYIGLQLTHSGRYAHPYDDKVLASRTAYAHPLLDKKFHNDKSNVVSDDDICRIIEKFIEAAKLSYKAGFQFVDIKHAHGYLGHELLSAVERPGKFGGSLENRTRFFREIAQGIAANVPGLEISMRLSFADFFPWQRLENGEGVPMEWEAGKPYPYAFGGDRTGRGMDFTETVEFVKMAQKCGVSLICGTIGSPYYNPHIQRPAAYAVSDGYLPPEDPLINVARHIKAAAAIKKACPDVKIVGSGYTYLQEYLPNVGEWVLANNMADFVGIGRMVLSYPGMCEDNLAGREMNKRLVCRTFGDCTSAPRNGMISGCFPLDEFYKRMPEALKLKEIKKSLKK